MYNAKKIKTFTPLFTGGNGPTCVDPEDAFGELLRILSENNSKDEISDLEIEKVAKQLAKMLNINDWVDGEYTIFEDYKLKIETMSQTAYDEMSEFDGY